MTGIIDYLETFGNLNFEEKEFSKIDALIFSQLAYIDYNGILDENNKAYISDAAMKFYLNHSEDEIENMIGIAQKAAVLLKECAKSRRFSEVRICHYINNVNGEIDKQFSAVNFVLPGGHLVVAYRGTDITVTGVKESAMLSYMFPVPAQIEALYYFQETALPSTGKITICGHSKGGNLAVFAGVNCANKMKNRIESIYEFDAPGFPKWFFDRYDFQQIKDKIHLITPQSSLVGRMLCHDLKPEIIFSDASSGLKQHSVYSWEIKNGEFTEQDAYDSTSDAISSYINETIDYVGDDDLELFYNTLEYIVTEMGVKDYNDLKGFDLRRAAALINSLSTLNEEQKEKFNKLLRKVSADLAKLLITSKAKSYFKKL
jgi:hypothetical protein